MAGYGYIQDARRRKKTTDLSFRTTIGRVVDTNDPQQMGRVRAFCPGFGDQEELKVGAIPWAIYVSPLGGVVNHGSRGAEESPVEGPVAYGMWNIPKVGAYVLVGLVDGDSSLRYYMGCIHPQYMTHSMPHGRYTWMDQKNGTPDGPLDTFENKIQPLYDNLQNQFTKQGSKHAEGTPSDPHRNLEWRTRGVDGQVSAITNLYVEHKDDKPGSKVADHEWGKNATVTEENGETREIQGTGYGISQQAPDDKYNKTINNYDSLIYSWTTPGFHSFSMDDRHENARIRIRTTSGHQIIMDDTNERIYISAAGGESWIEIDKVGNIDIFATKNISTHAGGDINFHSDKTIRMQANEGIHLFTDGDFRAQSRKDFNIRTDQNFRTHSAQMTKIEADTDLHVSCHGSTLNIQSTAGTLHMKSQSNMRIQTLANLDVLASSNITQVAGQVWHQQSGSTMELRATGGNINADAGTEIHLNDGITPSNTGTAADNAEQAKEYWAYWTSRVPEHEPWARVFMKKEGPDGADNNGPNNEEGALTDPNTHVTEFAYGDEEVGKGSIERGETYTRNPHWHR